MSVQAVSNTQISLVNTTPNDAHLASAFSDAIAKAAPKANAGAAPNGGLGEQKTTVNFSEQVSDKTDKRTANADGVGAALGSGIGAALGGKAVDDTKKAVKDALDKGDVDALKKAIKNAPKGFDINNITNDTPGHLDESALVYASSHPNAKSQDLVKVLVEDGRADLTRTDGADHTAAYKFDYDKSHSSGADGATTASWGKISDYLIDKTNGELGAAAKNGDQDRAAALIKAGAHPTEPNTETGVDPLAIATAAGKADMVQFLLDKRDAPPGQFNANFKPPGMGGNTLLHLAAASGDQKTYDLIKGLGGDDGIKNDAGHTPADILKDLRPRGFPDQVAPFSSSTDLGEEAIDRLNGVLGGNGIGPMEGMGPLSSETNQLLDDPISYSSSHFVGPVVAGGARNGDIIQFNATPDRPNPSIPTLGGNDGRYITGGPDTGHGPNRAYFLDYAQNGNTPVDTTIRVPAHPRPGDPSFVFTPPVTGCAFYATPDPHDPNFIIFHHVSGPTDSSQTPTVPHDGTGISYGDYESNRYPRGTPAGSGFLRPGNSADAANGVSTMAHYDDRAGQWVITGQPFTIAAGSNGAMNPFQQSTGRSGLGGFTIPVPSPQRPGAPPNQPPSPSAK